MASNTITVHTTVVVWTDRQHNCLSSSMSSTNHDHRTNSSAADTIGTQNGDSLQRNYQHVSAQHNVSTTTVTMCVVIRGAVHTVHHYTIIGANTEVSFPRQRRLQKSYQPIRHRVEDSRRRKFAVLLNIITPSTDSAAMPQCYLPPPIRPFDSTTTAFSLRSRTLLVP